MRWSFPSTVFLPMVFAIAAYFWRIQTIKAARYFDRAFHLDERVSTALELQNENHSVEIIQKQLDDAVSASRAIKPSRDLPLHLKKLDVALAVFFTLLIGALWFRGETLFAAASQQRAVEEAIAAEQTQIEEIIKEINANESLTDEQKQALAKPLEDAMKELKDNPSVEGAVSTLVSTSEELKALSNQQAAQIQQALTRNRQFACLTGGNSAGGSWQGFGKGKLCRRRLGPRKHGLESDDPRTIAKTRRAVGVNGKFAGGDKSTTGTTIDGCGAGNPQRRYGQRTAGNVKRGVSNGAGGSASHCRADGESGGGTIAAGRGTSPRGRRRKPAITGKCVGARTVKPTEWTKQRGQRIRLGVGHCAAKQSVWERSGQFSHSSKITARAMAANRLTNKSTLPHFWAARAETRLACQPRAKTAK